MSVDYETMNKKAFTLMELLLSIAVLAVVAASAVPTFFGGAKEVLEDSKKANMSAAYQHARTGANLLVSIATAQAITITGNLDSIEIDDLKKLDYFAPIPSRTFEGKNGCKFVFGAKTVKDSSDKDVCVMTYVAGEDPTQNGTEVAPAGATDKTVHEALNNLWDTVFAGEPQQ